MDHDENIILQGNTQGPYTNKRGHKIIEKQMNKCIVKIEIGITGSGFFLKFPIKRGGKDNYFLATNNHIIDIDNIKKENNIINLILSNGEKKYLKITKDRKRYSNEILDITLIEIIKKKDEIEEDNFLELDNLDEFYSLDLVKDEDKFKNLLKNKYHTKRIYNISYPETEVLVSYGNADNVYEGKGDYAFPHSCETKKGSSGSPILLLENDSFKVFGIHCAALTKAKNRGVIIFPAIKEFIYYINNNINEKFIPKPKQKNPSNIEEVKTETKEQKIEKLISEKIPVDFKIQTDSKYMIIKYKVKNHDIKVKILGKKFVSNNKKNCAIKIINNENNKYFYITEFIDVNEKMKKDEYVEIKLVEINQLENMSFMFGKALYDEPPVPILEIKEINNWSTKDVINMSKLFCECNELISLPNLSFFNTEKVKDMSFMFFGCEKLKDIKGFKKWKTDKVKNMSNMFAYCRNLNFIDSLAEWNVENVEDMSYMFYECRLLQRIDGLETWFPKKIINYNYFIFGCKMLNKEPDLSLWKKSEK